MATLTVEQFLALEPTDKTQRKGLGNGLYGLIIPKNKKKNFSKLSGKYYYWKNSKFEKELVLAIRFQQNKQEKKFLSFKIG